jgi:hypothetical protein
MRTGPPDNGPRTNEVVTTTKIATMHLIIIPLSTRPRLKNFVCRVLKKTQRRGARRSMSGGVLSCTLTRNRSSAMKHMRLFQRPAKCAYISV